MVNIEKLEKGTYFKDAFKVSYKYDPQTLNKIRQLSYRRYLPEEKAWEIPASELVHLIDLIGIDNINADPKYLKCVVSKEAGTASKTSEEVRERLKGIITFDDKSGSEEYTLEEFEKELENEHSQKTQQADPEE